MAARDKKLNQKNLQILLDLLNEEENKICVDCHTKGPRWASWNLGIFICIRCAGIHRNLGVHISRVKSVNLDAWTEEQIQSMQAGGNKRAQEIYEKELPPNFRRPSDDSAVENFIRAKYIRKQYVGKDTPSVSTKDESASKPKEKPKKTATAPVKSVELDAPRTRPSHQHRASELPDVHTLKVEKPRRVESSPDLVSLDTPVAVSVTPSPAIAPPVVAAAQQPLDLLFSVPTPSVAPAPAKSVSNDPPPLMTVNTPSVKDSILSLYNTQPTTAAYAANGLPVNPVYYQQQQAMAMQMAQQQQAMGMQMAQQQQAMSMQMAQQQQAMAMQMAQQQQLLQIQQQMEKLKLQQQQQQQRVDQAGTVGVPSGQTLNPQLW